jgi:hypothetical protein
LGFACKKHHIAKSNGFKFGGYGGQSAEVRNSTNNCWAVPAVWTSPNYTNSRIFGQDTSSVPRGDVGVDTFAGENQPSAV